MRRQHLPPAAALGLHGASAGQMNCLRRLRFDDPIAKAPAELPARSILALASLAARALDCPYADVFLYEPEPEPFGMAFDVEIATDPVPFAWRSFCASGPLVVTDACEDIATRDLPEVAFYPAKRFFCGVPIGSANGPIGTLVAFDFAPKPVPSRLSIADAGLVAHTIAVALLASRRHRAAHQPPPMGPIRI